MKLARRASLLLPAALVFLLGSGSAAAQQHRFEVDAALGYQFGGAVDVEVEDETGRLTLDGSAAFTGIFSYRVQESGFIFFNYTRQKTTLRYRSDDLSKIGELPFTTDFLQFGGNLEARYGSVTPYFGLSLGATRLAGAELGDEWRFSVVLDGGAKINLTHWLHVRAFARMPVTILEGDSTVLCVVPGGCVARLDGTPLFQGAFFLGVGFEF